MSIIGDPIIVGGGSSGGGSVVVWDEPDAAGGVIRHIEADSAYGLEDGSGTPSTSQQEISPTSGKYFRKFTIGAMPAGTEGTPTATKGPVSNNPGQVTPKVTNGEGFINGGVEKTGTPVTVSAGELVSGKKEITSNGDDIDVTTFEKVKVAVSGGSSKNVQYVMDKASVRTNGYTSTGMTLTVAKTGTYKISWVGWRSSSQGAMGSCLYKNGNAGTNQTTFTNTYGQQIVLENQSLNAGDVLTLYATANSTSRYMWVANLIIEEQ